LNAHDGRYECASCRAGYPVVDGIPQLIAEQPATAGDRKTASFFGDLFGSFDEWMHYLDQDTKKNGLRTMFAANGIDLSEVLSSKEKVLEAGCGYGRYTYELLKEGGPDGKQREITCLDLSQENLVMNRRMTRTLFPDSRNEYVRGSVTAIPLPDRFCDLCICTGVIHHIDDYWKGLDEVVRVIQPGGTLIFAVMGSRGLFLKLFWLWRLMNQCIPYAFAKKVLSGMRISDQSRRYILDAGWAAHYHQVGFKKLRSYFLAKGATQVAFLEIYRKMYGYSPLNVWFRGEGFMHMLVRF